MKTEPEVVPVFNDAGRTKPQIIDDAKVSRSSRGLKNIVGGKTA